MTARVEFDEQAQSPALSSLDANCCDARVLIVNVSALQPSVRYNLLRDSFLGRSFIGR